MTSHSNGKHRIPVSEKRSRLPERVDSQWLDKVESGFASAHEVFMGKATGFIRERPGVSLILAATVGGLIGWFIKRRS